MSILIYILVVYFAATSVKFNDMDGFLVWLNGRIKDRGWSIRETARKAGISHTLVSNAVNGGSPTFETCVALARVFGEPPEVVIRLAGLLPPVSSPKSVAEEVAHYKLGELNDQQLDQVLQYIEFIQDQEDKTKKIVVNTNKNREGITPPEMVKK